MKWKTRLLVAALALALAAQPYAAAAQTADDPVATAGVDKERFWDYVVCSASIAAAVGTQGWIFAAIACGRALHMHFSD